MIKHKTSDQKHCRHFFFTVSLKSCWKPRKNSGNGQNTELEFEKNVSVNSVNLYLGKDLDVTNPAADRLID